MSKVIRRVFVILGLAVLTGCSAMSVATSVTPGFPTEPDFAEYDQTGMDFSSEGWITEPVAGWIQEGETFAIVTWGSSSCPYVATSLSGDDSDGVRVEFTLPKYDACTDDLAPLTHVFELPESVTQRPVAVAVTGEDKNGRIIGSDPLPEVILGLD
ncbi:MAG: hypothetical protein R2722_08805 [Tessaracoccus sp.]